MLFLKGTVAPFLFFVLFSFVLYYLYLFLFLFL